MANERGYPKLSYEVWKINFHTQVAEENHFLPFKIFLPRTSILLFYRSTNNTEVIKLAPIQTDYKRMCGHKLEFQVNAQIMFGN